MDETKPVESELLSTLILKGAAAKQENEELKKEVERLTTIIKYLESRLDL